MADTFVTRKMQYHPSGGMHGGSNFYTAFVCEDVEHNTTVHLWVLPNIPDTAPFRVENVPVYVGGYPPPSGAHCRFAPVDTE